MIKYNEPIVILSQKEYDDLTNPDIRYTLMTVTAANKAVKNLLEHFKFKCWHDDEELEIEDFCCSTCPIYEVLGYDAVPRLCLREKTWVE